MKIFCYGSINIDDVFIVDHILQSGETQPSSSYQRLAGGKGANQSVAAAQANAAVIHLGKIGTDAQWILDMMQSKGVDISHVLVDQKCASGRAIIQVSQQTGDNAIILYAGTNKMITEEDVDGFFVKETGMRRGDWVLAQNEVNGGGKVLKKCFDMGMIVLFNPAPMTLTVLEEYSLLNVHILVMNETEAMAMYKLQSGSEITGTGLVESMKSVLQKMSNLVPNNVTGILITLGEHGLVCRFKDAHRQWYDIQMPARKIKVVDTTGAGDTFVGYFAASLSTRSKEFMISGSNEVLFPKEVVEWALKRSTIASSLACSVKGAMTSIPPLEKVMAEE